LPALMPRVTIKLRRVFLEKSRQLCAFKNVVHSVLPVWRNSHTSA